MSRPRSGDPEPPPGARQIPRLGAAGGRRGQLVLLSGVVVALALLAMLTAFLQLGYHADVATSGDERVVADGESYLQRVTHDAARDLRGEYDWSQRDAAVTALRSALEPRLATLERSRAGAGVAATGTLNRTAAERWADTHCPSGTGREFGPCRADRGVVVQERDGRTLVVGVAYDLGVTTEQSTTRLTTVVEPVE